MRIQRLCTAHDHHGRLALGLYACPLSEDLPREKRHTYAHFAALELLSAALAEDWGLHHCRMVRDAKGKPMLVCSGVHVNLSHSRKMAVCGIALTPLGVDCEGPRQVKSATVQRVCAESEQQLLLQSEEPAYDFARLWTLKEAYGKCTGEGIRMPLTHAEFDFSHEMLRFLHTQKEAYGFLQLLLPEKTVVSVCMQQPFSPMKIHCREGISVMGSESFPRGVFCYAAD